MVFTTAGFLEVAIESWPEWDLNPRPLTTIYVYIVYTYIQYIVYVIYIYLYFRYVFL